MHKTPRVSKIQGKKKKKEIEEYWLAGRMTCIFRGGILNSKSFRILLKAQFLAPRPVQLFCISNLSSKPRKKAQEVGRNAGELQSVDPLFDEILEIFGSERIKSGGFAPCALSAMQETKFGESVGGEESSLCGSQTVCENADEKKDLMKVEILLNETKVIGGASVVHDVVEVVRCESGSLSMEERLKNADFRYSEEVIVNVLKKCFKVPHLALRFFNWVKLEEGFRHTTNTFNMMINVVGEAKELGLVEELVEEMEKSSC